MNLGEVNNKLNFREMGVDLFRMFLGAALFLKGIYFMTNMHELYDLAPQNMLFSSFMISHYVILAHVAGGLCIFLGLITRVAAIFNMPAVLGAILFVYKEHGVFSGNVNIELAGIVLMSLIAMAAYGSGKFSVDEYLDQSLKKLGYKGIRKINIMGNYAIKRKAHA